MTIKDCIDRVDNIKPNQYTIREKVMWLSFIEKSIINDVLKTHEGYDGRYDSFEGYSEDKLSVTLVVPFPHDELYVEYLKMMIDKENGEIARYNNSAVSFNSYMTEYKKHYNKTHMPLDTINRRNTTPPKQASVGLSDAEYENLKRDMTYILTEYFSDSVSADKLSDIVVKYAQNNMEMLKGKDGETPIKGVDYFNDDDKAEFKGYIDLKLEDALNKVREIIGKAITRTATITLYASKWVSDSDKQYSQVVAIADVTSHSKIDLQPTPEQLVIFHEKDASFVTENDDGVVTVYCIGQKPTNDYTIQAIITEVNLDG